MKRFFSVLVIIALLMTVIASLPISVSAESLYIRKIVSVVYDDSGSMSNNKSINWAYANYALQSFCGLLNSDDQLYVTYMSDVEKNPNLDPPGMDLGASKVQESVDSIREHVKSGGTPYKSIDVAFKKLKSTVDTNVNTQYWLVVITDGAFQASDGSNVPESELSEKLKECVNTQMPNGSTPQVSYLAIGSDATMPAKDERSGLFVYKSSGSTDIIKTMSEIADKVSGRSRLSKNDIVKKDSKTVEIKSTVPLLNIAVLSQKTTAKIVSVSGQSDNLSIVKSASIKYPEKSGRVTDETLVGGTCLINNSSNNIPSGTYQIKFDNDVDIDNIVVMFEPALEIRMSVKLNGAELKDLSELTSSHESDKVEVSCKLYEIGTNNEISSSLLPPDTVYELKILENGNAVKSCNTIEMKLPVYELQNTKTEITATVHIKGFNPIVLTTGEFTPVKKIKYTVDAQMPDNFSMTMAQLKSNTEKIYFTIYADGVAVDQDTAKALPFSIDTNMPGKVEYESDGRISFLPVYQDPVTAIPTGDVEITGALPNIASKTVTIYIKPLEYLIKVVDDGEQSIIRTQFAGNEAGIRFEVFVDDEKLDKKALELATIQYNLNDKYDDKVQLEPVIEEDGTVKVTPKCDIWSWWAAYAIPTGSMEITASYNNSSDTGRINITRDAKSEFIWNWLIPFLILVFILGQIFKYRFKYSYKIHYNSGSSSGSSSNITGPRNGWNTSSLFTLTALIPFMPDVKSVNGAKFYAKGFFWNAIVIKVKPKQYPEYSGTLNGGLNEMESVRFSKHDITEFENGEKNRAMIPGNALVTSGDRNYGVCQIYLYSEK